VSIGAGRVEVPGAGAVSVAVSRPPDDAAPAVILAHGAGADMRHPFMTAMRTGLAREGFAAVTFNFPYTEAGRRAPDRPPVLEACWRAVLDAVRADPTLRPPWIAIGGKSMGGRIASHLAAGGAPVAALVLLGYPLHAAGRPDTRRAAHLGRIRVPMLFVQGTRDALCDLALLRPVLATLPQATLHTIAEGDHSFGVPKRTGRAEADVRAEIVATVGAWLRRALTP
jgi:predicted alpha/beta-hydrolase family hydrolase